MNQPTVTLFQGDCLEFMKTLAPGVVDAVVTDPPYGMNWDVNGTRYTKGGKDWGERIINDSFKFDPLPFLHFPKVIMWGYNHFANSLPKGSTLVWIKRNDRAFGSF